MLTGNLGSAFIHSLWTSLSPLPTLITTRGWRAGSVPTHLGIEGVLEDLTQGFGIGLRFTRLCAIQDGRLDPLGHCLPHQLGRELDGSGRKGRERTMGNARLGLLGRSMIHDINQRELTLLIFDGLRELKA